MNIDDYFNINESSHAILYKSKNLIFSCKFFFSNDRSSSQLHYGNKLNYNKLKSNKTIGILSKMIKVKMVDQF